MYAPYADISAPVTLIQGADFQYLLNLPAGITMNATAQQSVYQIFFEGNGYLAFRIVWILAYASVEAVIWGLYLPTAIPKFKKDRRIDWLNPRFIIVLLAFGTALFRIIYFSLTGVSSSFFLRVLVEFSYLLTLLVFAAFLRLWVLVIGVMITFKYHRIIEYLEGDW